MYLYGAFLPFPGLYFWENASTGCLYFMAPHVAEPDLVFIIDVWPQFPLCLSVVSDTWHQDICFVPGLGLYLSVFYFFFFTICFSLLKVWWRSSWHGQEAKTRSKITLKCHTAWVMESPWGTNMHHLVFTWNCCTTSFCFFQNKLIRCVILKSLQTMCHDLTCFEWNLLPKELSKNDNLIWFAYMKTKTLFCRTQSLLDLEDKFKSSYK